MKNTRKQSGTDRKQGVMFMGIRNKIFICFMVPIVFMLILGTLSYRRAASSLNQTFRDSTIQTIAMASEYIDMNNAYIETEAVKYVSDSDLSKYILGLMSDKKEQQSLLKDIRLRIMTSQAGNKFIGNMYIIPQAGSTMVNTKTSFQDGFYDAYMEQMSSDGKNLERWADMHEALDEYTGVRTEDYISTFQIRTQKGKAVVVVDVGREAVLEFLAGLNLGDNSIVGYITAGGREVIAEQLPEGETTGLTEGEVVFADKEYYKTDTQELSGVSEITYKGGRYLYLFQKSERTGASICAMVPMHVVTGKAEAIKRLNIIGIVLAAVLATLNGIAIASGIRRNMGRISRQLAYVAEGNLTAEVAVKGKDEFRSLAAAANNMIANNKKLVLKVSQATNTLGVSANEVTEASGVIQEYSDHIARAIGEITDGMERQSRHAQECVQKTDILSTEIQEVNEIAGQVEALVQNAEQMISQGMSFVQALEERAAETTAVTAHVEESIQDLKRESETINEFVATINAISEETNLLSLNASIEAARAGAAGRGFAVVAEEIRKLADSSAAAAGEIQRNVENINQQTAISVDSAKQAGNMVALQTQAVREVDGVFRSMREAMTQLFVGLKDILVSTERADKERQEAVEAVRNISKIIENTAQSTQVVADVAANLQENVESLNGTAEGLGENMNGLKTEIAVFKTE